VKTIFDYNLPLAVEFATPGNFTRLFKFPSSPYAFGMNPKYLVFMHSSDEAFKELKKIVIEEYGEGFSDVEIRVMGARLLGIVDIITSPDTEAKKEQPEGKP